MYTNHNMYSDLDKVYNHYKRVESQGKLGKKSHILSDEELIVCEHNLSENMHKLWDKSFHGIPVGQSIAAVAGVIQGKLSYIKILKSLINAKTKD